MKVSSRGRLIKVNRNYFDLDDEVKKPLACSVKEDKNGKVKNVDKASCTPVKSKSTPNRTPITQSASVRKSSRLRDTLTICPPKPNHNALESPEVQEGSIPNKMKKKSMKAEEEHSNLVDINMEHSRWQTMKFNLGTTIDAEVAQYLLDWFKKTAPPVYHQKTSEGTLDRNFMLNMLEGAHSIHFQPSEYEGVSESFASNIHSPKMEPPAPEDEPDHHELLLTSLSDDADDYKEDSDPEINEPPAQLQRLEKSKDPPDGSSRHTKEDVHHVEEVVNKSSPKRRKSLKENYCLTKSSSSSDQNSDDTAQELPASAPDDKSGVLDKSKTSRKRGRPTNYTESTTLYVKTDDGHFKCTSCNIVLTSKGGRRYHEQRHSRMKTLACNMCDKKFSSLRALTAHMKFHQRVLQCDLCPFTTWNKKLLQKHKKENHNKVKDQKTKALVDKQNMNGDEQALGDRYMCDLCGKNYARKHALVEHQKLKHSAVPQDRHVCQICGKSYMLRASLNVHCKNHEAPKHKCPECGKMFYVNSTLQLHLNRVHLNVKKYQCEDCGRRFKVKMHLLEHRYSQHLHVRPFLCPHPECTKAFYTRRHQMVHSRIHTGEKPIKCKHCDYSCRQAAALKWHMHKHTNPHGAPKKRAKSQVKLSVKSEPETVIKSQDQDDRGDHVYSVNYQDNSDNVNEIITQQSDPNIILADIDHVEETVVIDGIAPNTVGHESVIIMESSLPEPIYVSTIYESPGGHQVATGLLQPAPLTDPQSLQMGPNVQEVHVYEEESNLQNI